MGGEYDRQESARESQTGSARVAAADEAGMEQAGTMDTHTAAPGATRTLIDETEAERLRARWSDVQQKFVDDPRHAMDEAANLVSSAVERIESVIRDRLDELGHSWPSKETRETDAETEHLRALMQRYRDLLDRLLGA